MSGIKLFVSCHKAFPVPQHPLLAPIQVGAALAPAHFPGFLHDDAGENISALNRSYCELTAQYWAWKNADLDYYGFFHYRRYLYPDPSAAQPYRLARRPDMTVLAKLGYDGFEALIRQYDLILPMKEDMHTPVSAHYAAAPYHHSGDLALVRQLIAQLSPEYVPAADDYFSSTGCYFGNIFIMNRSLFFAYCQWLFPLLAAFDQRADTGAYSPQERRVDGYLAERLLGVFALHQQRRAHLRVLELPRVHFIPDAGTYYKTAALAALLPPGSRRRSAVKQLAKGGGKHG